MDETVPTACPCEARSRRLADVAARTNTPVSTVRWISGALTFAGCHERRGVSTRGVDARELCRMLVADTGERRPGPLRDWLVDAGIPSSEKVGLIVYALVEAELCATSPHDKPTAFDSIFDAAHI
jgi:hypothetical protein